MSAPWRYRLAVGAVAVAAALAGCTGTTPEEAASSSADLAAAMGSPTATASVTPSSAPTTIGSHRAVPAPKRTTTHRATPKPTHRPTPAPTHRPAPKPKPKPKPAPPLVVHPGAFCSDPKATGVSARGVPMRCKTTAKDDRLRWRRA